MGCNRKESTQTDQSSRTGLIFDETLLLSFLLAETTPLISFLDPISSRSASYQRLPIMFLGVFLLAKSSSGALTKVTEKRRIFLSLSTASATG